MSDISLTKGMRSNLLALQSTVNLMNRTQERLSTGKKVNSALDNPTNFFTALSHTSRANDLLGFKDAISESIQTIKAADGAISGITSLINSAKAVAEDAKGALGSGAGSASQTLTINTVTGITAGTTINVGGVTLSAVASGATAATNFNVGSTTDQMAISIANAINAAMTTFDATVSGSVLTITAATAGATMKTGDIEFAPAMSLAYTESAVGATSSLTSKVSQYATLMDQLDDLQADGFYKGKNLLDSETMTVRFGNAHTLDVVGFAGDRAGLGLDATLDTTSETSIQAAITKLETALETLKTESSNLSSNLSIVNTRDEWITSIATTLQTGADNLTLADTNEEGANMLMLQTRQSLSTSALSLSAQAAQSVLKLFQ